MTFIHELDPYYLQIYRMCENELLTSRLWKVIVSQRECVHLVTSGHFRSRYKDGGHTTRSVLAENSTKHANLIASIFYRTGVTGDRSFRSRE